MIYKTILWCSSFIIFLEDDKKRKSAIAIGLCFNSIKMTKTREIKSKANMDYKLTHFPRWKRKRYHVQHNKNDTWNTVCRPPSSSYIIFEITMSMVVPSPESRITVAAAIFSHSRSWYNLNIPYYLMNDHYMDIYVTNCENYAYTGILFFSFILHDRYMHTIIMIFL